MPAPRAPGGWTLAQRLRVALLSLSVLLLAAALLLVAVLWEADRALSKQTDRTFPARLAASQLMTSLVDQETALRGYALLEKTRDEQQTKATQAAQAAATENSALSGRVTALSSELDELKATVAAQSSTASTAATENAESLAALQRSSSQAAADAAAARMLAQQLQGANSVLAQENYRLKTLLAGANGGPAPSISTPTPPAGARTHVIAAGDSLSKLSQRYYGTASRWQEIYNANTEKLGPQGILRVGVELRIP